jgi:hypothetical protein
MSGSVAPTARETSPARKSVPARRLDPAAGTQRSTRPRITAARSSASSNSPVATSRGKVRSTSRPCDSAFRSAASSGP